MLTKYMPKWTADTFKKKQNYDMTTELWSIWNRLYSKRHSIYLHHVYSHNKSGLANSKNKDERDMHKYNDIADKLATYARLNLLPAEELWNS